MDDIIIMDELREIRNDGKEIRKDVSEMKITQAIHTSKLETLSADVEFLKNKKPLFLQAVTNPLVIKAALWIVAGVALIAFGVNLFPYISTVGG